MSSSTQREPLGLLRLRAEARLGEFAENIGVPADELWEIAMTAQTIPAVWEILPGAREFWVAFSHLKTKEIQEFASAG